MALHKCVLIVDDFGLEYVRKQDADHLASVLKNYHDISQDWEGTKFAGIDLDWNNLQQNIMTELVAYS